MRFFLRSIFYFVASLLLFSCSFGQEHGDLKEYIAEVKAKPAGAIEPLPAFRPFEAFIYGAAGKRSPFDRPIDIKQREIIAANPNVKPDFNRPKEYLESFDIAALKMVGNIESKGVLWALLSDQDGVVHWVREGNYIGKNHGRIVETTENNIEVIEIVSDGLDGWVERPRIIALEEPAGR